VTNSDSRSHLLWRGLLQHSNVRARWGGPYEKENVQRSTPAAELPMPAVVLSRAPAGAVTAVPYDWLDQRALLQWADDGGRWVGAGS
jgi:hypothetical protein